MRRLAVVLLVLACFGPAAPQTRREQKQFQIEVVEVKAARVENRIALDGKIKNTGQRDVHRLILVFNMLDSEQRVLSSRRGRIEEDVLEPDQEAAFHFDIPNQARAVYFRVEAEYAGGSSLDLVKAGPFPID
jgi:hypothetical protein